MNFGGFMKYTNFTRLRNFLIYSSLYCLVMIEAVASDVDQAAFYDAIELGHQEVINVTVSTCCLCCMLSAFTQGKKIVEAMNELRLLVGRPKRTFQPLDIRKEMEEEAIRYLMVAHR